MDRKNKDRDRYNRNRDMGNRGNRDRGLGNRENGGKNIFADGRGLGKNFFGEKYLFKNRTLIQFGNPFSGFLSKNKDKNPKNRYRDR